MNFARISSAIGGAAAAFTFALATPIAPPAFAQGISGIEEIVVTARRREESLQSVPISVTAFSGDDLTNNVIVDDIGLANSIPSLNMVQQGARSSTQLIAIRGVGTIDSLIQIDPGVGIYFAEIPQGRPGGFAKSLYDIQNVQVLRGPQGTLFGRNTTGGAILVEPNRPTDVFDGAINIKGITFNTFDRGWGGEVDGHINIPINDMAALHLAGRVEQKDGDTLACLGSATGPGCGSFATQELNDEENYAWRASLALNPTDRWEATFIHDYYKSDRDGDGRPLVRAVPNSGVALSAATVGFLASGAAGGAAQAIGLALQAANPAGTDPFYAFQEPNCSTQPFGPFGPTFASGCMDDEQAFRDANAGEPRIMRTRFGSGEPGTSIAGGLFSEDIGKQFSKVLNWGILLDQSFEVSENLLFKSLTGYRQVDIQDNIDFDGSLISGIDALETTRVSQISQEFQLQGQSFDDQLDWVFGAFMFHENGSEFARSVNVPFLLNTGNPSLTWTTGSNWSYALFAEGTMSLDDWLQGLSFTGGFRYTWDGRQSNALLRVEGVLGAPDVCRIKDDSGTALPIANCSRIQKMNSAEPTWNATLTYEMDDETTMYVAHRRGYRAGGLQQRPETADQFVAVDPEFITDVEVGLKKDWMVGETAIRTNLAVFHAWYRDIIRQTAVRQPSGAINTILANAAQARVYGGEFEATIQPTDNFELSGFVNYVHGSYQEFDAVTSAGLPADRSDEGFNQSMPTTSYRVVGRYQLPFDADLGPITIQADWYHQNEPDVGTDPNIVKVRDGTPGSWGIANVRADWQDIMGSPVDMAFFVQNIGDKLYKLNCTTGQNFLQTVSCNYGAPRTFGLELRYQFGGEAAPMRRAEAPAAPAAPMGCEPRNFLVFFDWDRSDLTTAAAGIVDEAAAHINAGCSANIDVTGHTDASGGAQYNMGLSKKRAETVAQGLINRGVSANQIMVNWKGESEPLVATPDGVREPQNRRVEINAKG